MIPSHHSMEKDDCSSGLHLQQCVNVSLPANVTYMLAVSDTSEGANDCVDALCR